MDSFMDKLAQKFNAQEMIKANTVAEEKELEKRRAEAEEYKVYLAQMKELNQENAELTEKIEAMMTQLQKVTELNQSKIDAIVQDNASNKAQLEEIAKNSLSNQARMEQLAKKTEENMARVASESVSKINKVSEDSLAKVNKIADEGVKTVAEIATINKEKMEKIQASSSGPVQAEVDLSQVENNIMVLTQNLEEEKKKLAELFEQTNEYVHRENVKVYRNVQAVVVEEVKNRSDELARQINEQNEEMNERLESVERVTNSVKPAIRVTMTFSIITAVAALGAVMLYILTYLNII